MTKDEYNIFSSRNDTTILPKYSDASGINPVVENDKGDNSFVVTTVKSYSLRYQKKHFIN